MPTKTLLLTESYKETVGEPTIIRRAKGFSKILNEMDISIGPWQIVVGNFSSKPFSTSVFPEYSWRWIIDEIENFSNRDGDKFRVTKRVKDKLYKLSWWKGQSIEDKVMELLPLETKQQIESGVISSGLITSGIGQYLPDYERILRCGISGIRIDVSERLKKLNLTNPKDFSKRIFYESLLIVCDAIVRFAHRYSDLALEMSKRRIRPQRRRELQEISYFCKNVPSEPASSFHEAVQSFWFLHLLAYLEIDGAGISSGRLDQFLFPYYERDIKSGRISRDDAKRILTSLWMNFNQILTFYPEKTASIWAGYPITQQPTLGGVREDGSDAVNELSRLILEVEDEVRLPQPDIAIIYHKNMEREFFKKACLLLPFTMKPKFFNHSIATAHLLKKGTSKSELSKFSNIGCVTLAIPGKMWGPTNYGFVNLPKCLELALNDGLDPLRNRQVGPKTGDSFHLDTFEKVYKAYCKQVKYAINQSVILSHALSNTYREYLPLPYASIMVKGCIEKGRDVTSGGARYNIPGIQAVGIANVADGLFALKEIVFKMKKVSLKDFINVLKKNFPSNEVLYKSIEKIPKYGNDIEEVDLIARQVGEHFCMEVRKFHNSLGFQFWPALYSISAHAGMGYYVGATPDGRKAREPLADGISPAQGRCLSGPTSVIKSVCRINHIEATNGTLLNMKFNANMILDPDKLQKFMALIDGFMELGGYNLQFNIIDTKILREAQRNPEKYPDLLVRVAAYVAQFTMLPKRLQDDIISRSELA